MLAENWNFVFYACFKVSAVEACLTTHDRIYEIKRLLQDNLIPVNAACLGQESQETRRTMWFKIFACRKSLRDKYHPFAVYTFAILFYPSSNYIHNYINNYYY